MDPMRSPSIPLLLALLPSAASYAIGGHAACPSAARTTTPLAKAAEFFFEMAEDRSKVTFGCATVHHNGEAGGGRQPSGIYWL